MLWDNLLFPNVWIYLTIINIALIAFTRKYRKGNQQALVAENEHKHILLIIAHPDDESMFFVPSIVSLRAMGYHLHALSLSNGNGDGKGKVREKELEKACKYLGIEQVTVVDDPKLADGLKEYWEVEDINRHVREHLKTRAFNGIITFDEKGVSGHLNHIMVHMAVQKLRKDEQYKDIKMLQLETVGIIRKYIGLLDLILSVFEEFNFVSLSFWINWKAMAMHWSQFVWYRWLFIFFSKYTYSNTLREMPNPFKTSLAKE
jgi:N-acetylglucosaminylphosphatidylinositol deacetylase